MQSSYWETNRVLSTADLLIVGGGFTGLSAAHFAHISNPSLRIAVVDQQSYGQVWQALEMQDLLVLEVNRDSFRHSE